MLPALATEVAARELTREEVATTMSSLLKPQGGGEAEKSFLTAWALRGETAAELAAAAEALLPLAKDPGVRGSWNGQPLLDCCGTGGGGLNLLNISTGLMFILAAMGIPVVKHGNRGITKKSGSADVLEALKIRIFPAPESVEPCLEKVGAAFLFATPYHESFAAIAALRRELGAQGQRTIFNLLGPLLNPARPDARLVGVFKPEHVELYRTALAAMGCPRFSVAHGEDALTRTSLGEISARGPTRIGSTLRELDGTPFSYLETAFPDEANFEALFVRDADDSARRLVAILSNEEHGLARETFLINAAVAAWTQGATESLNEARMKAAEALDSGRALERLRRWQEFSAKA